MKTLTWFILIAIVISGSKAKADRLDLATHNSLINKLESAIGSDSSDKMLLQKNMAYRLADLYAERARLLSMDEQGRGEQINAAAISKDRKQSIAILEKILSSLDSSKQGPALLQIAHLELLQGQNSKALQIFKKIESNSLHYDKKTISLVEIQLGDVAFNQGDLKSAKLHFEKASKIEVNPRLGYTFFRKAWVSYNQGDTKSAEKQLIELLGHKQFYTSVTGVIDNSFLQEVSHDLALFIAKNDISETSLKKLSTLSPENSRKANLIFLASELDRTAKKESALKVWKMIGSNEATFDDQLIRQIQVTRIEYDLGHKRAVVAEIERSLQILQSSKCLKNAECTVATQNLRRIITDWAKAEERAPSKELIQAFQKFTNQIVDSEMSYYAAQAAVLRKEYSSAFILYEQVLNAIQNGDKKITTYQKLYEGSLIGSIEVAELTGDSKLKLQAYKQYLELNPKGPKSAEVKYQIAHWYYENNNYLEASSLFLNLALDQQMPGELREKAADLCLDSDVIAKNEVAVEKHALELSKVLPIKKQEYLGIYRKSVLNEGARILNENKIESYEAELLKLSQMSKANFTVAEQNILIKTKIELSFRLKQLDSLSQSALELLETKKLSTEDHDLAIRYLVWIAEVKMNFKLAVKWMQKEKPAVKKKAEYYFKLATLKELAHENPIAAYENFLNLAKDKNQNAFAAHQIVTGSKNPGFAFKRYEKLLINNLDLYIDAGIFAFDKNKDEKLAHKLLQNSAARNTFQGNLLAHHIAFGSVDEILKAIKKLPVKVSSDSVLKKTIKQRSDLLQQLEKVTNLSIQKKDTVLQLVFLAEISEQNEQLAKQILSLPLPKGLSANDQQKYRAQVQSLVKPYTTKAESVRMKTTELWKQAVAQNLFQNQSECLVEKVKPGCQIAAREVARLRISAGRSGLASDPFEKLSKSYQKSLTEADLLQKKVQDNPFNLSDLARLKSLHATLGHGPMIAYLNNRLSETQTKKETR